MISKRGAMGEGILMIYRLLVVSFVAFIILGVSSVFYAHYINVREVEAKILTREVVECISPDGLLDLDNIPEEDRQNILSYCGFGTEDVERFYVEVNVEGPPEDIKLFQGDSGAFWVLGLFEEDSESKGFNKYKPGLYESEYPVAVIRDGNKSEGSLKTKVLVKDEF